MPGGNGGNSDPLQIPEEASGRNTKIPHIWADQTVAMLEK